MHPTRFAQTLLPFFLTVALGAAGCARGGVVGNTERGGSTASAGGGNGGSGGTIPVITLAPTDGAALLPTGDAEIIQTKEECDGGAGCVCPPFNVAVIGKPGKWGANPAGDPDTALQDWLTSSSVGTAKVSNFTGRTTLTADLLATYNVIVLASQGDDSNVGPFWAYSDPEIAAFRAWIENGGGVISLMGYSGNPDEGRPVNQLIGFSGITYTQDGVYTSCVDWQICSCTHSKPLGNFNTADPLIASLATNLTYVGFENGRTLNSPADGHVVATVEGSKNVLVGKTVGKGRVLAYGDEWITYTSQWTGEGNPSATDPNCQGKLPQDTYQTAQFWFNMIKWSSPGATCFKIVDKANPVKIW